jgi:xanthine permease XanP
MEKPPGLIYGVDDRPPLPIFVLAALQLVAVTSNSLVYPIIIARAAGLDTEPLLDLISLSMVAMGVGTVLFCRRAPLGSGYLCPAGFSSMYLAPSLYALQTGGLALVFGMTMVAGALQVVLAPLLGRLRPVFRPHQDLLRADRDGDRRDRQPGSG